MEKILYDQLSICKIERALDILNNNPEININWTSSRNPRFTFLHVACIWDLSEVLPVLLSHPKIDVNAKSSNGSTPFWIACMNGSTDCVKLLLKDERVDMKECNKADDSPFCAASAPFHTETIQWYIASGREIKQESVTEAIEVCLRNIEVFAGEEDGAKTDIIESGKQREWRLKVMEEEFKETRLARQKHLDVLEAFKEDPEKTRASVRKEIGWK
jgi:ankyrin repeat protein